MNKDGRTRLVYKIIRKFDWDDYGLDQVGEAHDEYARHLAAAIVTALGQKEEFVESTNPPGSTRWRPIDPEGNVAPDPAPEIPDDADEGETGPEETQG